MAWRLAKSLIVLRDEFNRANPGRDKSSDGTLGDPRHRAGWESSDHNPWVRDRNGVGVVRAIDLDAGPGLSPGESADAPGDNLLACLLRAGKGKHPALGRGSYVIYEGYIYKHSTGFRRETYRGANKHHSHVHVSVGTAPVSYDTTRMWGVALPLAAKAVQPSVRLANLRYGASNGDVRLLQQRLAKLGYKVGAIDGIYGAKTRAAILRFQRDQGWSGQGADGVPGPKTLALLSLRVA